MKPIKLTKEQTADIQQVRTEARRHGKALDKTAKEIIAATAELAEAETTLEECQANRDHRDDSVMQRASVAKRKTVLLSERIKELEEAFAKNADALQSEHNDWMNTLRATMKGPIEEHILDAVAKALLPFSSDERSARGMADKSDAMLSFRRFIHEPNFLTWKTTEAAAERVRWVVAQCDKLLAGEAVWQFKAA